MTTYYHAWGTGAEGGTGTIGDPFLDPCTARTAMADPSAVHLGKGRYIRLNTGAAARVIQPPASGTAKNPTIFHGYDPANPFEWWCGSMLRTTAAGGPTWTADGGDVHHCSLGFLLGAGEAYGGRLLWYYDPATPAVPPRQLYWMPDAVGGAQAGCVATVDSFWFNTTGNVLYVHLRSGESPNGRILLPEGSGTSQTFGDRWDTATASGNGLFAGRKNIVFSNFSYLYCGTRPWSYQVASYPNGHDCDRIELRRGWFGFTGRDDRGVIMPTVRSGPIVIDECRLQCGALGIIYSWGGQAGVHVAVEAMGATGHIAVGLRATRNHLLDAGYTHRGQGDGHAIGAQASASDWICAGNLCDQTVRPITMWPRSNWYPGVVLAKVKILANTIVNTHDSGIATAQRMISWENTDTGGTPTYDQSGSEAAGNVIRGPIGRIAAGYYNGALLDLSGTPGSKYDSPCGIRTARTSLANRIETHGNEISGMSWGLADEQTDPASAAVDYRWNKIRDLTQHVPTSLRLNAVIATGGMASDGGGNTGKVNSVWNRNAYDAAVDQYGRPGRVRTLVQWRADTNYDVNSVAA